MPTYEYECPQGHRYEKREGFDAPAKQKCEVCGKTARRVLFAPPIVFKGSGFYVTDSRGSGTTASPSSEGSSDDSTASDSDRTPATASTNDHGHSHGPSGHTHDAPAKESKTSKADSKKADTTASTS